MGNDLSKEIKDIADILEKDERNSITPTSKIKLIHVDPRSPTEGIVRTPIEVRKAEFTDESYLFRRKWKSETDVKSGINNEVEEKIHLLRADPRSPTLGIIRTPIQVCCDEKTLCAKCSSSSENLLDINAKLCANTDLNVIPDCRSPSLGISRTPIEITAIHANENAREVPVKTPVDISKESSVNITPILKWHTPVSKQSSSSFVYTDEEGVEIKGKEDMKQYKQISRHEKENDASLKRRLVFTPESVKQGIKARTPLGSRCNFQDSPSQLLKIMQVQKVGQEMALGVENASVNPSFVTKSDKKTHSVTEWDNKDSTIIL